VPVIKITIVAAFRVRVILLSGAMAAVSLSSLAAPHSASAAEIPTNWSDFDDDGFRDLVVGAPNATVTRSGVDHPAAGAVYVIYGTANGPSASRVQLWTQDSAEGLDVIGDFSEDSDHFGAAAAAGDFNNDGVGDLAIGVPGEDRIYTAGEPVNQHVDAGAVEIIFGKAGVGLTARNDVTVMPTKDQDLSADPSSKWDGSQFGISLATLDMFTANGGHGADGIADLAVGASGYNAGNGLATVVTGGKLVAADSTGLVKPTFNYYSEGPSGGGSNRHFGATLTGGDFDDDGISDLAVSEPSYDFGSISNAGAVAIVYGDSPPSHGDALSEGFGGNPVPLGSHDLFGSALAAGDVTGDGIDDLVIGAPGASVHGAFSGRVQIYDGSLTGHVVFDRTIDESSAGVPGDPQTLDLFGGALAIANVGNGSRLDLLIGAPGENVAGGHAGALFVLFGTAAGFGGAGNKEITQNTAGIPDTAEESDSFGSELIVGQLGHGGPRDVAIGNPDEDLTVNGSTFNNTGLVHVLFGASGGLSTSNDKRLDLTTISIGGQVQAKGSEGFGKSLE